MKHVVLTQLKLVTSKIILVLKIWHLSTKVTKHNNALIKYAVLNAFKEYSFLDDDSNWGHAANNLNGGGVAMTVANINGKRWFVNSFGSDGKHKINLNQDLDQLEAN